jgi:hypothetical protein
MHGMNEGRKKIIVLLNTLESKLSLMCPFKWQPYQTMYYCAFETSHTKILSFQRNLIYSVDTELYEKLLPKGFLQHFLPLFENTSNMSQITSYEALIA